jgi:hypothetical protein
MQTTDSHSWGVGIAQIDAWKIEAGAVYFNLNLNFYGVGNDAGDKNDPLPINEKGMGLGVKGLRRIAGHWYGGLRFMISPEHRLNVSLDFAVGKDLSAVYFYVAEAF